MRERIKAAIAKWRDTGRALDMVSILEQQLQATHSPDANVERVRDQLLQRSVVGLKKYGVTTAEGNLQTDQWLQHLQEELLDAAVYVEALKQKIKAIKVAMGDDDASQRGL